MKLASIVPVSYMEHTCDYDYAMLLAHLSEHYPENVIQNRHCYKIMDNSLIECGNAMSIDDVIAAAERCQADEVILPDVLNNGVQTFLNIMSALRKLHKMDKIKTFRWMAVCQGKTLNDFEMCFSTLCDTPEIHCIGIPKVASRFFDIGRPGLEYLWQNCSKEIHLLGVAKNLIELTQYKHPAKIRSVDTCIPALLSQTTNYAYKDRPEKTIDLLNDTVDEYRYEYIMRLLKEDKLI